jgi:tetratricopeptide (TPR) repeat protein
MNDELRRLRGSSLSVQVHGPDGSKLGMMAIVTLCNVGGQSLGSQTTFGARAIFSRLSSGIYYVYVQVPGFRNAKVQTELREAQGEQNLVVTLEPDESGMGSSVPGNAILPKAQKQVNKAIEEIQANKFDEAIKNLEAAQHIDSSHAEIPYLLGMSYEKKNNLPAALKSWEQAIQVDPKHLPTLLASGEALLRTDDLAGARKYLDKAVEAAPASWEAHTLLGEVLLRQSSYADAVTHSQRAVALGKERAGNALLVLGQALLAEGEKEKGLAALESYLATKPPAAQAEAINRIIERAKHPESAGPPKAMVSADLLSDLPLTAAAHRWFPPSVDEQVPPVEPDVPCSLEQVLRDASERVQELPAVVDRYTATEVLKHEELNNAGYPTAVEKRSFNYLVSIGVNQGRYVNVEEYRDGSMGTDMFPYQLASNGLPSIVLIFHPLLISEFNMNCEGLGRMNGSLAWQIHFEQRKDVPSQIRRYRVNARTFPVALKGRAWIDANTHEVLRIETDLREPYPDLRLTAEHLVMEYGPVEFKKRKEVLWLPASADYYAVYAGHRFHRRHTFTDYILFSVDDQQKIGAPPKATSTPTAPGGDSPPNPETDLPQATSFLAHPANSSSGGPSH